MTYQDWIETFKIAAKCNGGVNCICSEMWKTRHEQGIGFINTPSASDLRKLSRMHWFLGSPLRRNYYGQIIKPTNRNDDYKWLYKIDNLSDEELIELFAKYKSIYTNI